MSDISSVFLIGLVIVVGYLAQLAFRRTKVPDVLILMLLGMLVGPVFGLVDSRELAGSAPLVGILALIVLLFQGGVGMNLLKVLTELAPSTAFTLLVFVLSSVFSMGLVHFVFGWPLLHALLLGVVVGGTSSEIVLSILAGIRVPDKVKVLLSLESVITDALVIIVAVALLQVVKAGPAVSFDVVANQLAGAFAIAAVIGVVAAVAWLRVLKLMQEKHEQFTYVVSLAVVLLLYSFVEGIKANGGFAVLVFGLVLGNAAEIAARMKLGEGFGVASSFKTFQTEFTFFIRTFFFVYLGLILQLSAITAEVVGVTALVLASLAVARYIGTAAYAHFDEVVRGSRLLIASMIPRGLAPAVLAYLPLSQGISIPGFAEVVFMIILSTNIIASIGTFLSQRGQPALAQPSRTGTSSPASGRAVPKIVRQK